MRFVLGLLTMSILTIAQAMAGPLVVMSGEEGTTTVRTSAPTKFNSAYTDLDLDECLVLHSDDFGTSWACPGYKGYPVWVAEGDLRFLVSFGFGAPDEVAASQTLPPFNTLGPRIEWRLSQASGGWQPVAAIIRYRLDKTEGYAGGEVLAVLQLAPGATCHIAWIDARANKNANELAREAANKAGAIECPEQPEIVGAFGAWEH